MRKFYTLIAAVMFCGGMSVAETVTVNFEDIDLGDNIYDNGASSEGKFTSGGFDFINTYNTAYGSWDGFAISKSTSTAFEDESFYTQQYNSCVGKGASNSEKYAVGYYSSYNTVTPIAIKNSENKLFTPQSVAVTNAAYAFNNMRFGNSFSKIFTEEDEFFLTFLGYKEGVATGTSVTVHLAEEGMILFVWKTIDLTGLGEVDEIRFSMNSTDVGTWGMNTPAYFCIDNFSAEVSSATSAKAVSAAIELPTEVAVYSADGKIQDGLQNGLNIVKMSDGTIRKCYK